MTLKSGKTQMTVTISPAYDVRVVDVVDSDACDKRGLKVWA